jgi:signal transduction histidine kinase
MTLSRVSGLIFGPRETFTLQERIVNGGCIVATLLTLVASYVNQELGMHPNIILACLVSSILCLFAWVMGKLHYKTLCLFALLLMEVSVLSYSYFYAYGSAGPTAYFYIATMPLFIFILERWEGLFFSGLLFINITVLYFLEHFQVFEIMPTGIYNNNIPYLYSWLTFSILIVVIIANYAKGLLSEEQRRIRAMARAKTDFLAKLSHEIRTPINAILGFNELALENPKDEKQKQWLEKSRSSAEHLLNLIRDIMDISRAGEDGAGGIVRPFNILELANNVVNQVRTKAELKGLDFQLQLDSDLDLEVLGKPLHIQQILTNLLDNAIKYTDKGSVKLIISPVSKPEAGEEFY